MKSYVTRSRGVYTFSVGVPQRHREAVRERWPSEFRGRTHVRVSLRTRDPGEATVRAAPLIVKWRERFAALDAEGGEASPEWRKARSALADMGFGFSERRPPDPKFAAFTAKAVAKTARERFRVKRDAFLSELPEAVRPFVDADSALADERKELDAWAGQVAELLEPYGAPPPKRSTGPTFEDAVERWKADRNPAIQTVRQVAVVQKKWAAFFAAKSIADIDKQDIIAWRQSMQDAGSISPQSINKTIKFAGGVLAAAEHAGMIKSNPINRIRALTPTGDGRGSFTSAEVEKLLAHAEGMEDETAAWIIRLGAYTGARLGEIVQLTSDDVYEDSGFLVIDINRRNGKTTKNKQSVRVVPVHSDISDRLTEYVKGKSGKLFWKNSDPSSIVNDTMVRAGVKREGVSFHSLRHSFKDRCREAGITEEIHDALTGHSGGGVGRRYGGRPPLRQLADAVARLTFPHPAAPSVDKRSG